MTGITRRSLLAGIGSACALRGAAGPAIETHVHLFDPARVPYAPVAPYRPAPYTLEDYLKLVDAGGLAHSIIVHPEPYQDDQRYLEYCFSHEPRPGYFKGVCLFDPFRDDTPRRVRALMDRWPRRIVAMRIHEVSMTPEAAGPIRNRDLTDPRMSACWRALASVAVGIQMHFIPGQAPHIRALASRFRDSIVILDHMGRPGDGSAAEYEEVLRLADLPHIIMKFSGWDMYHGDLAQLTRRIYNAFGADRMIWGMLGNTPENYRKQSERCETLLAFASEADRAKIRGLNAQRLFFA